VTDELAVIGACLRLMKLGALQDQVGYDTLWRTTIEEHGADLLASRMAAVAASLLDLVAGETGTSVLATIQLLAIQTLGADNNI
jgi:hypothetical protein